MLADFLSMDLMLVNISKIPVLHVNGVSKQP